MARPVTIVESETLFASAMPRGKNVENTHHRQSKANSKSCRACHRPYPPPHRRLACRRHRRRAHHHSAVAFADLHDLLLCDRHQTLGLRSASSQRCSKPSADALPQHCAHLRRIAERLAGEVQQGRHQAVLGVLAAASDLVRWEMFCPAGQSCLSQEVSMRPFNQRRTGDHRTCSYYLWSRHSSSCVIVHAGVVMFVVVKGPPRGWGAAQSMRRTASTRRRRRRFGSRMVVTVWICVQ